MSQVIRAAAEASECLIQHQPFHVIVTVTRLPRPGSASCHNDASSGPPDLRQRLRASGAARSAGSRTLEGGMVTTEESGAVKIQHWKRGGSRKVERGGGGGFVTEESGAV